MPAGGDARPLTGLLLLLLLVLLLAVPSPAAPRPGDDAFQRGNKAYGEGLLLEAESLYREAILLNPANADAQCNLGSLLVDQGDAENGETAYRQALSLDAGHAGALFNLALLLQERPGAAEESAALYRRVVAREPGNFDAWSNLGATLHRLGHLPSAVDAYERALGVFGGSGRDAQQLSQVHEHLGRALLRMSELQAPLAARELADSQAAEDAPHARGLAALRRAVALDPSNKIAAHMLAANERRPSLHPQPQSQQHVQHQQQQLQEEAAPPEYVSKLFDDFSSTFEASLQSLGYRAPALMAARLHELGVSVGVGAGAGAGAGQAGRVAVLLDLGCGTGLLPIALGVAPVGSEGPRPVTVGVDLSAGMLAVAEEKGVYDHLFAGEIVSFLSSYADLVERGGRAAGVDGEGGGMRRKLGGSIVRALTAEAGLDGAFRVTEESLGAGLVLVAAADVLVYIGDLGPLFAALARALRPGDLAVFTTEAAGEGEDGGAGWALRPSGRYAHSAAYLERAASRAGVEVVSVQGVSSRRELGRDVQGWLVVLRGV